MTAPGTTPRRSLTDKQKLTVMARYCRCPGLPERDVKCGKRLPTMAECEFDHVHARALGGSDDLDNYRPLCPECHAIKTFGRRGERTATTAGSDIANIAKARRNAKANAEFWSARMTREPGQKRAARGKIKSRPFPKRQRAAPAVRR